jgi:hypothetical protein
MLDWSVWGFISIDALYVTTVQRAIYLTPCSAEFFGDLDSAQAMTSTLKHRRRVLRAVKRPSSGDHDDKFTIFASII